MSKGWKSGYTKTYLGYEWIGRLKSIKEKWAKLEPLIPKEFRDIPLREMTYENKVGLVELMKISGNQGISTDFILLAALIDKTIRLKELIVDKDITVPGLVQMLGDENTEDITLEFIRNSTTWQEKEKVQP